MPYTVPTLVRARKFVSQAATYAIQIFSTDMSLMALVIQTWLSVYASTKAELLN